MRLSFGLLSLVALVVVAQDTSIKTVRQAFEDANIPKDLTINFDPTALLELTFPQEHSRPIKVHAGEQLPLDWTAGPPIFGVSGTSHLGPFVVTAVDPDAPTPQNTSWAQIRHFVGGNFFVNPHTGALSNSTPALSEFIQPAPPGGTHRYIFLLFKQSAGFKDQTLITPTTPILNFNVSTFAQEVGLGDPIAGTFMRVAPNQTA